MKIKYTETPRTNKNAGYYCGHGIKKNSDLAIDPNGPFVLAEFARLLERENAELKAQLRRYGIPVPALANVRISHGGSNATPHKQPTE